MITLLSTLASAQEPTRWWIESEVHLPLAMWLASPTGGMGRILGWRLSIVVACGPIGWETKRKGTRTCDVEDAALVVAPHEADAGRLGEQVVADALGFLRDATVEIIYDAKRGATGVDLDSPAVQGARATEITENLRLIVARAVAGLDLLPGEPGATEWKQPGSLVLRVADDASGAAGKAVVVHRRTGDTITSTGDGSSIKFLPSTGGQEAMEAWRLEMEASATVAEDGTIVTRTWSAEGEATASSAGANSSRPYVQKGRLERLDVGVVRGMPTSGEGPLAGMAPGSGADRYIGADPR